MSTSTAPRATKRARDEPELPPDAMVVEAALAGASLAAIGGLSRFRELLYDSGASGSLAAWSFSPPFSAGENALLSETTPMEAVMRSRPTVHHSRSARELETQRQALNSRSERDKAAAGSVEWPANNSAVAVVVGSRATRHFMTGTSLVMGRGAKCDVNLFGEWPSATLSRRAAVLSVRSDGRVWLKNAGKNLVFVNGTAVPRLESVALGRRSIVLVGGSKLYVELNASTLHRLAQ